MLEICRGFRESVGKPWSQRFQIFVEDVVMNTLDLIFLPIIIAFLPCSFCAYGYQKYHEK